MFELTIRQKIAALVLLLFLAVGGILIFITGDRRKAEVFYDDAQTDTIYVYMSGAVTKPGVIAVKPGTRKFEALKLAGGALPDADLNQVNLAEYAEDGEQVYFPKIGEKPPTGKKSSSKSGTSSKKTLAKTPAKTLVTPTPTQTMPKGPLDLNTATQKTLETIPGIGPVLAAKIIEYRDEHGNFQNYEDLGKVSGVGPSKLEKFRTYLTVK